MPSEETCLLSSDNSAAKYAVGVNSAFSLRSVSSIAERTRAVCAEYGLGRVEVYQLE